MNLVEPEHSWEWRGFGDWSPYDRWLLESNTAPLRGFRTIVDHYVLVPENAVNAKIRGTRIRIKHATATRGGWTRWSPSGDFVARLPARAELVRTFARRLGIAFEGIPPSARLDASGLVSVLHRAHPSVSVLTVRKNRERRTWTSPAGEQVGVEVSEIFEPQLTWTVAIDIATFEWRNSH